MEASGTSLHCEEISNDTNSQKDNINKKIIIVVIMITIQQNEKKKNGQERKRKRKKGLFVFALPHIQDRVTLKYVASYSSKAYDCVVRMNVFNKVGEMVD